MTTYQLTSSLVNGVSYPPNSEGGINVIMNNEVQISAVYTQVLSNFTIMCSTSPINIPFYQAGKAYLTKTKFTAIDSQAFTVTATQTFIDPLNHNYQYTFSHWSNGEKTLARTIYPTGNYDITAYYVRTKRA